MWGIALPINDYKTDLKHLGFSGFSMMFQISKSWEEEAELMSVAPLSVSQVVLNENKC